MRNNLAAINIKRPRSLFKGYDYVLALSVIIITTIAFHFVRGYFAKGQWALLYLLVILTIANLRGVKPALFTAILAFFTWNYFLLPPYLTLRVSDSKDWLFLIVFLIVGIIVGLQTGRLKIREELAIGSKIEADLLNSFSARLVSDLSLKEMSSILVKEALTVTSANSAMLFLPNNSGKLECISSFGQAIKDVERAKLVDWSYHRLKAVGLPKDNLNTSTDNWPSTSSHKQAGSNQARSDIYIPLATSNKRLGVIYIGNKVNDEEFTYQEVRVLVALANQASAFLERKKLHKIEIEAKGREEADKFKSVIVSSIQHELKTPLASINATVSNLLEADVEQDPEYVKAELDAIEDDLHRLNGSIGSLIELSRLESSEWKPKKDWYEFGEILGNAISRLPQKYRKRVSLHEMQDSIEMNVDFMQIARVLQLLIENASAYSKESVRVGATKDKKEFRIWIEDNGPGIEENDKKFMFDKFYRGKAAIQSSPGTGLGLAIALEIVKFHGGRIEVEDVQPHGSRFVLIFPVRKRTYYE